MGLIEGLAALTRRPAAGPGAGSGLLLVIDAVGACLGPAALLGLLAEPITRAAARLPAFAAMGAWLAGGPRRWFARAPDATATLSAALLGLLVAIGPVFPAALMVETLFHSKPLAATAIMLVALASFALAPVVAAAALAPLRWVARRAGRLASPGVVLALTLLATLLETARFARLHRVDLPMIQHGAAYLPLAFALGTLGTAAALAVRVRARNRPLRRAVPIALCALALGAFAFALITARARPGRFAALRERTAVPSAVLRVLPVAPRGRSDGPRVIIRDGAPAAS